LGGRKRRRNGPNRLVQLIIFSSSWRIRHAFAITLRSPPSSLRTYIGCRFSRMVAEADSATCAFAQFSSRWRTGFSHLRGGSENCTVVPSAQRGVKAVDAKRTAVVNPSALLLKVSLIDDLDLVSCAGPLDPRQRKPVRTRVRVSGLRWSQRVLTRPDTATDDDGLATDRVWLVSELVSADADSAAVCAGTVGSMWIARWLR
jgi:hypothetical protein